MMINKNSNDKFNFQADLVLAVLAQVVLASVVLVSVVLVSVVLVSEAAKAAFQADLLQEVADSRGNLDLLDLLHLKFHSCSQ
jgi:hypothetical protein